MAGIRVQCYKRFWSGCKSDTQRINKLKELLKENGVSGRPTLEKCRAAKRKRERIQEAASLNPKNILSEGINMKKYFICLNIDVFSCIP